MSASSRIEVTDGFDCLVTVIDGRWVERRPRRPAVEDAMRTEARLLDRVAPGLPLPVPRPVVVSELPFVTRYRYLAGTPNGSLEPQEGARLGAFLRVLHSTDLATVVDLGISATTAAANLRDELDGLRQVVLPRLPAGMTAQGEALLDRISTSPVDTLVHADLTGDHVLSQDGRITGVIDWTDARIGDPAIDLAWSLQEMPPAFAAEVIRTYEPEEEMRGRAADWYRLIPWWGVHFGSMFDDTERVATDLRAAASRLQYVDGR